MNKPYNEVFSKNDITPVTQKVQKGLNSVANPVKSTFGPCGNTVLIDTVYAGTIATKDGVTVAKSIELKDPVENIAASMIKQVASKTVDEAGDGTTTATILAQALFNEGLKILPFVKNRNELKRSIKKFSEEVVNYINSRSTSISLNRDGDNVELLNIAKISSNNDIKMAEAIVEAFKMVGEEGIISVDDGTQDGFVVEHISGLRVDAGMVHPYFMNDFRKQECEQSNPIIMLVKDGISTFQPFKSILEYVGSNGKAITIFSDNFTENIINVALQNKLKAGLDINLVKVQGYGANKDGIFEDIAAVTGATPIEKNTDPKEYMEHLGKATKVISNKSETRIVSDNKDEAKFNEHLEMLKSKIDTTVNKKDIENIETRISKLIGGVATIKVSGKSPEEVHEIKDRLDDAINAVRSALEEGYVIGGGTIFYDASNAIKDDGSDGYRVIKEVLQAPLKALCENSGESFEYAKTLLDHRDTDRFGINFARDTLGIYDLVTEGVIDPAKVLRVSLESAVSVVSLLLTSDYIITTVLPDKMNDVK